MPILLSDLDAASDAIAGVPTGTAQRMRRERANGICPAHAHAPYGVVYCDRPVDPQTGKHTDTIPYLFRYEHRAGAGCEEFVWQHGLAPYHIHHDSAANQDAGS